MKDVPDIRCQIKYPNGLSSIIHDDIHAAEQEAKAWEMDRANHLECSPEDLQYKTELHYYFSEKSDIVKQLVWSGYKFSGQRIKR